VRAVEFIDEDLNQVLKFATDAHSGQSRSSGEPYINHPIRVAQSVEKYKKSKNLDAIIAAAYLHDTIEDTGTTHEDLEKLFGGLVASLVKELTSDKEQIAKLGKTDYLAKKMAHDMTSYALVIKLADRLDNVQDITTAKSPKWRAKYREETERILSYLEDNRILSNTHKELIRMIKDKLKEIPVAETNTIETVDIDAIHAEMIKEYLLLHPELYENNEDYTDLKNFLEIHNTKSPVVGKLYVYASVQFMPTLKIMTISQFSQLHKLKKIDNEYAYFQIDGTIKRYPETSKIQGDAFSKIYFFDTLKDLEKFIMLIDLKFSGYRQIIKILDNPDNK
jgi:hypothetical protein